MFITQKTNLDFYPNVHALTLKMTNKFVVGGPSARE